MGSHLLRRLGMVVVVLGLLGIAGVGMAAPAAAHVDLTGTAPRDGQVLANAPERVVLSFDETVDLAASTIVVVDPDGTPTAGVGAPGPLGGASTEIALKLPAEMEPGTRTVVYRVLSADGHPVQGEFRFSVGVATASATPDVLGGDEQIGLYLGVARWAAFVGLALAIGTMLLVTAGWPAGAVIAPIRRLVWAGLATLGASSALSLLLYGPYVAGRGLTAALDPATLGMAIQTRVGTLLVVRLVLVVVAGIVLAVWLRVRASALASAGSARTDVEPVAAVVTVAAGGLLALTWSLAAHAATGNVLVTLPVDLVHMLAMSAWLGGMPALLLLLLRVKDRAALARAVPLFSRTATVCVLALVLTGVLQSWRQVGSAQALTTTDYGGWLMVKVGLVALILGLGACARWWALPRLQATVDPGPEPTGHRGRGMAQRTRRRREAEVAGAATRFGRIVAMETGMGAVVLAVTATLVSTQPASAALASRGAKVASAASVVAADPVDTRIGFRLAPEHSKRGIAEYTGARVEPEGRAKLRGWARALISPAVGALPNELHLTLFDHRGRPLDGLEAAVELRSASSGQRSSAHMLTAIAPGHYIAPFTVPGVGDWQLGITLRDATGRAAVVLVPIMTGTEGASHMDVTDAAAAAQTGEIR